MAETIIIEANLSKEQKYKQLIPQLASLLSPENEPISNLANFCAALKEVFHFFWVGFYLVKGDKLILGPFQGPVACTEIHKNRGVCCKAWAKKEIIVVPNVHEFEDHIACSALSQSEIVLPLFNAQSEIMGVLDVDSEHLATFDVIDAHYLAKCLTLLPKVNDL
jgi:GAF domain-containing protein